MKAEQNDNKKLTVERIVDIIRAIRNELINEFLDSKLKAYF
jgi:hypothetical protein